MTETIEQWNARVDAERAAKHAAKHGTIETPEPKTGSAKPFRRAREMYMSILELKAKHQFDTLLLQALMNAFPQYRSRGHGGRHRTKNHTILGAWNQSRSKYMPHQGGRECARRSALK